MLGSVLLLLVVSKDGYGAVVGKLGDEPFDLVLAVVRRRSRYCA
jgi:hypothetical protein